MEFDEDDLDVAWRPAVWRSDRVRLWDYQRAPWRTPLLAQIKQWNAVRPRHVPRIEYIAAPELLHAEIDEPDLNRRGIVVSNSPQSAIGRGVALTHVYDIKDRTIVRAHIVVSLDKPPETAPYCHELMHAMTSIGDDPLRSKEQLSCVLGRRRDLGPFDLEYLESVYRFARRRNATIRGENREGASRIDRLLVDRTRASMRANHAVEPNEDGPLFRLAMSLIERL